MSFRFGFGPRLLKLSFGSRGTRLSTGAGPVSFSVGGRRRPRGMFWRHGTCTIRHRTPGAAARCKGTI